MTAKQIAAIVVACGGMIVVGVWIVSPRGVTPETGYGTTQKGEVPGRSSAGLDRATETIHGPTSEPKPFLNPAVQPVPASQPSASTKSEKPMDPTVARFADTAIPVETRMAEVEQLGKSGEADAVRTLMKLGDAYTYLNFKAVEALGNVKTPEVAQYLAGKLGDKDPKVIATAIQSLAKAQGVEAVSAVAAAIAANRQRPDGFQDTICAAGVKALGEIGSATAIPALAEEFEKTVGKTLQHEYGSQVVAALRAIGDAAGAPALKAYAARLENERAAMADNPMGQRYLEGKIKEVTDAISMIEQKGVSK